MAKPDVRTLAWAQAGTRHAVTLFVDDHLLADHDEDHRLASVAHLSDLTSSVVAHDLGHEGSLYVRHVRGAVEAAVEWPREDQDEYGREMAVTLFVSSGPGWAAEALADYLLKQAEILQAHDFDLRPGLPECRDAIAGTIDLSPTRSGCTGRMRTYMRDYLRTAMERRF